MPGKKRKCGRPKGSSGKKNMVQALRAGGAGRRLHSDAFTTQKERDEVNILASSKNNDKRIPLPREMYHDENWNDARDLIESEADGGVDLIHSRVGNRIINMENLTAMLDAEMDCRRCKSAQVLKLKYLIDESVNNNSHILTTHSKGSGKADQIKAAMDLLMTTDFPMLPEKETRSGLSSVICFKCAEGHEATFVTSKIFKPFVMSEDKNGGPKYKCDDAIESVVGLVASPSSSSSSSSSSSTTSSSSTSSTPSSSSTSTSSIPNPLPILPTIKKRKRLSRNHKIPTKRNALHSCLGVCDKRKCNSLLLAEAPIGLAYPRAEVNIRAAAGGMCTALGGVGLYRIMSMLDIPCSNSFIGMTNADNQLVVGYGIERHAELLMNYWIEQEKETVYRKYDLAMEIWDKNKKQHKKPKKPEVRVEGKKCTVLGINFDGMWIKRGAGKKSYNSPYGVQFAISAYHRKIIQCNWYGQKCRKCTWAIANGKTIVDHDCVANFTRDGRFTKDGGQAYGQTLAKRMEPFGAWKLAGEAPKKGFVWGRTNSDDDATMASGFKKGAKCIFPEEAGQSYDPESDPGHRNKATVRDAFFNVIDVQRKRGKLKKNDEGFNETTYMSTVIANKLKKSHNKAVIQNRGSMDIETLRGAIVCNVMHYHKQHNGGEITITIPGAPVGESSRKQAGFKPSTSSSSSSSSSERLKHGIDVATFDEGQEVWTHNVGESEFTRRGELRTITGHVTRESGHVAEVQWDDEQSLEMQDREVLERITADQVAVLLINTELKEKADGIKKKQVINLEGSYQVTLSFPPCGDWCKQRTAKLAGKAIPPMTKVPGWGGPESGAILGTETVNDIFVGMLSGRNYINDENLGTLIGFQDTQGNEGANKNHTKFWSKGTDCSQSPNGKHRTYYCVCEKDKDETVICDIFEQQVGFAAGYYTRSQFMQLAEHNKELVNRRQQPSERQRRMTAQFTYQGDTFKGKSSLYKAEAEYVGDGGAMGSAALSSRKRSKYGHNATETSASVCKRCKQAFKNNKTGNKPSAKYYKHIAACDGSVKPLVSKKRKRKIPKPTIASTPAARPAEEEQKPSSIPAKKKKKK
jgi:hypothetical protein